MSATAQADELLSAGKLTEAQALLNSADQSDAEVLWRLSRTHFELSEVNPADAALRQAQLEKSAEYGQAALAANPNHYGPHKYFALSTSALGQFQSSNEKISNAFKIKEHADKAASLNPSDAQTFYLLGRWSFSVASVGWIERKVASALFGTPPSATYDDALTYLKKSAELDPQAIRTASFLGDTYYQLSKYQDAKEWYQKALTLPTHNQVDKDYVPEIKTKLSKL